MPSLIRFRNSCYTINNPTENDFTLLSCEELASKSRYHIAANEIGEGGNPHIQGYIEFNDPISLPTLKKWMPRAHLEHRRGTSKQASAYCKKGSQTHEEWRSQGTLGDHYGDDLDLIFEIGEISQPGVRKELTDAADLITDPDISPSWTSIIRNPELYSVVAKHHHWVRNLYDSRPYPEMTLTLRPWQQTLLDKLLAPANDRTIYWMYDPKGNQGKSTLCKFLVSNHDAIMLTGKAENMFSAYDNQRIILVDLPRATDDKYINYSAIEKLKDGLFFVGKYESHQHYRPFNAHVVVFSNFMPEDNKYTDDRLDITQLSRPDSYSDHSDIAPTHLNGLPVSYDLQFTD